MSILYQPSGRAGEYACWAANLYRGCSHGCVYCYAAAMARRFRPGQDFTHVEPRPGAIAQLERDVARLAHRVDAPVQLAFTTDPYVPLDADLHLTRQAIRVLHAGGLAVQILTKAGDLATRDFDLLTERDWFGVSLTLRDEHQSREWEPHAALPAARIAALAAARQAGLRTWVSCEPVIDPAQTLALIAQVAPIVDYIAVGKLNGHPHARTIDWVAVANEVQALLDALGVRSRLKQDLRCLLPDHDGGDG